MNEMSSLRQMKVVIRFVDALAKGYNRRRACKEAGLSRATFYRWMQRKAEFRSMVLNYEREFADERLYQTWYNHPFRGLRPPSQSGDNRPYPTPRFQVPHGPGLRRN
tara:strand:- start:1781 stop:2101 length:321 start_codon:yes stop_codon:yes gene_type:complete